VAAGGGSGGRGVCKRGQRRVEIGPGQGESDAWRPTKQEVEWQRQHNGGRGSCIAPAAEGAEQGSRGCQRKKRGSEGLMCKTRKSRDLSVK
jgi:hypothetical protein